MDDLENISREVIDSLPSDLDDFAKKVADVGTIEAYTVSLGVKIQSIFEKNNIDLSGDDSDVAEFRHIMKNMALRVNRSLDNPEQAYFWVDIFRRNLETFFIKDTAALKS